MKRGGGVNIGGAFDSAFGGKPAEKPDPEGVRKAKDAQIDRIDNEARPPRQEIPWWDEEALDYLGVPNQDVIDAWLAYRDYGRFTPDNPKGAGPLAVKELEAWGAPLEEADRRRRKVP